MHSVKFKLVILLVSFQAVIGKGISSSEPNSSDSASAASDASEAKAIKNYKWYHNTQADYAAPLYSSAYPGYQQLSSRDSYTNAAADLGYAAPPGGSSSAGHVHDQYAAPQTYSPPQTGTGEVKPIMYHYKVYPTVHKRTKYGNARDSASFDPKPSYDQTSSYHPPKPSYQPQMEYGSYGGDDDEKGDDGGLGGLAGLIGLLGLKGLKAGILPLLPLLLPLFLPLLILPIGLLIVAALFIPIPLLVIPQGRSISQRARVAKALALSEDCIERITCETARFAKGYGFDATWIDKFLERTSKSSSAKWIEKVSRGAKSTECKQYTCNPITNFKKSISISKTE